METRSSFRHLILVLLWGVLSACGGGGGGSQNNNTGDSGGNSEPEEPMPVPEWVSFNLKDATAVLVYEGAVSLEGTVIEGLSAAKSKRQAQAASSISAEGASTNLLALGEDGELRVAFSHLQSPHWDQEPVIVSTVPSPDNRYLYVVMESGAYIGDPDAVTPIWSDICFLFKVDLETNNWSCLPVVGLGNEFGSNQAVQFDKQGQTYIVGCAPTNPNRQYWRPEYYCDGYREEDDSEIIDVFLETEDGSLEALGVFQDNEMISSVRLTKDSDVVYSSQIQSGNYESSKKLWRGGQVLVMGDEVELDTLAFGDNSSMYYTVYAGYFNLPAPVFMKPRAGGTLSFDRLLLGPPVEPVNSYSGRLVVTDDGKFYAFTNGYYGESYEPGEDGEQLWQLLPRRELILEDIKFGNDVNFVANLAIRISGSQTANHGVIDRLSLTPLVTGGKETLLFHVTSNDIDVNPNIPRYDINMLTIDGHLLYFSALDLSRNMNVVGAVDLDAYNSIEGDGEEKIARMDEYLTISDVGSASGAAAQLQDIKALKGPMIGNNEELPVLQSIDFDSDNPYSISLHFSKAMDQSSVESNLQFVNTSSGIGVPYMTLWLGNSLHLLVDLNDFGEAPTEKGLPVTRPLSDGTSYKVILDSAASDRSGNMLANEDPGELTKTVMIDI